MSTPKSDTSPAEVATPANPLHQPRRFRWEQNYEMNNAFHWALNDTHTDAGSPLGRVTCAQMILLNHWNLKLQNEYFPKLIVELLNKHFQEEFDKANGTAISKRPPTTLQQLSSIIKSGSTLCVNRSKVSVGQDLFAASITQSTDSIEASIGRDIELEAAIQFAIKNHIAHLTKEREKLQSRLTEINQLIP